MRRNPVKSLGYSAVEAARQIAVPSIFVVAENEELSGNAVVEAAHKDLGKRGVPSDFHILKGATCHSVCSEAFDEATRVEIEWFERHLKKQLSGGLSRA